MVFSGQRRGELLPGVDAEFLVHVPQVVLHRLGAQEECGGGLLGCPPARQGQGDLQFLWGQRVDRGRVTPPAGFAGRGQFGARTLGPRPGAETLEGLQRGTKLLAGEHPVPGTPQALTVGQPGACRLEGIKGQRTGTAERYVREWLNAQAAGGYVSYDPDTGRYLLPPEQAAALTDPDSPAYLPGFF
jgi:Rv2258c-like winged HTH domain